MNSDQVAVRHTVNRPWRDRDAGDTDRANHGTLSVRHDHIHARGRYGRVAPLQVHVRNFNAEEIQPGEPATEIAAQRNKPRRPILFSERASTLKGKKRCIDGDPAAHGWSTLTIKPCLETARALLSSPRATGLAAPDPSEAGSDRHHFSGCDLVDRTDHLQLS